MQCPFSCFFKQTSSKRGYQRGSKNMKELTLKAKDQQGRTMRAIFLPEAGMNLASYTCDGIEAIAQGTKRDFEERFGGLGALIGPHFYHLSDDLVPKDINESLFPHIAKERAKGTKDVFSHGIGRYVPWEYEVKGNRIKARLNGSMQYKGVELKRLEGCDFAMTFDVLLDSKGLHISLSVEAERASVIGLHYYYTLPKGKAVVIAPVGEQFNDMGTWNPMPEKWLKEKKQLYFDLSQEADYGFRPPSGNACTIDLQSQGYHLRVSYQAPEDEHAWQLYHPNDSDFVCIEPVSAKNPRGLTAKKSAIEVLIQINPE